MKIGIMGGTFNPIHNGHLMLGKYAKDLFGLDEVWFMPNGNPPHKEKNSIEISAEHRAEMVKRAIVCDKDFVLQMYEVQNTNTNYSYLTMEYFKEKYPQCEFYFIVGADSLFNIEKWKCPDRLFQTSIMLAAYRDGKNEAEMMEQISYLKNKYQADIRLLQTPNVDISSSDIRLKLKIGMSVEDEIPNSVLDYIKAKNLYSVEFDGMREKVKEHQSGSRFEHTLGVMYTAAKLATCYRDDVQKALIAGLLHDCAKGYSSDDKIKLCEEFGIKVLDCERKNPELLHAKLGAHLAKAEYHIEDKEILDAIYYHTTGRPEMTMLDKIIYVADYIEPNRNQAPHLDTIRLLAYEDIDKALIEILKDTLDYLNQTNKTIDVMTEKTYQYYNQEEK